MDNKTTGATLRSLRERSDFSVKEVVELLKEYDFRISDKTLYSYESGKRAMSGDMLLTLCRIYKCNNILETFGDVEADYEIPDDYEWDIIQKYRNLDAYGKKAVDSILSIEYARCRVKEKPANYTPNNIKSIDYYRKMASAGNGQVIFENNVAERITIPDIPEYERVAYAIGVNGNSMEPLYYDGDILLVEPTVDIKVGEIGIFIINGEAYVKKLGASELISLNKEYDNIPLTEYSSCMGRVADKLSQIDDELRFK